MTTERLNEIIRACQEIPEFDRTPEQQAIVQLFEDTVKNYEVMTGESWNHNIGDTLPV